MDNLVNSLFGENKKYNSERLTECIEYIRNSGKIGTLYDILKDAREDLFIEDKIHGINHNKRVCIFALYIGLKEGLNDNELILLINSALYHDIGRKNKEDNINHGDKSAQIIEENRQEIFPTLNQEQVNAIKALCSSHSHDDKEMERIAEENGVKDRQAFIKIAQILKDADALDRVRLPRFGKLDSSYLRTSTSKQMIDIAQELYFESISVYNEENKQKDTKLEDDEFIYLFRALTDGNIQDRIEGIQDIRSNSEREYSETGEWGEYSDTSNLTLEELYKHTRMQYKHCYTNCISLTEDPNVALTYNPKQNAYILVKMPKTDIPHKFVDAREYYIDELKKVISNVDITGSKEIQDLFTKIEQARSNEELISYLKSFNKDIPVWFINDRQYFNFLEELEYHKIIAKLKVLYDKELIGDIIPGIENESLFSAIGNAFTSAEYIHYGTIKEEQVIDCPKMFMDIFALISQAKNNGADIRKISQLTNKIMLLMQNGATIDLNDEDKKFLEMDYTSKELMDNELTINNAYELTKGEISYIDTRMQVTAIRALSETILKKRILIDFLKDNLPEEYDYLEEVFRDTYCINPEYSIKQNGRGHQISNSVNILITDMEFDLGNEQTEKLIKSLSKLSKEQLEDIYINGINSKVIKNMLIQTREDDKKIEQSNRKNKKTQYITEAIIEGYDWTRGLIKKEKTKLAQTISPAKQKNELNKLYNTLQEIEIDGIKLTQKEIFAVIINSAIDKKLGDISYSDLLNLPKQEQKQLIESNIESLQTAVNPISIDLLMRRGKTIKKLRQSLINLGISEEFIEEKDERNVYTALEIVEEYFEDYRKKDGNKITNEENKIIIERILSTTLLNKNVHLYLTTLIDNLDKVGIQDKKEQCGFIIKSAVDGNGIDAYSNFIHGRAISKLKQFIENNPEGIKEKCQVTDETVKNALIQEGIIPEELKKKIEELGISEEFIKEKDIKNINTAFEIVEGYFEDYRKEDENKITNKEKIIIIESILSNALLSKEYSYKLTTLIENLERAGIQNTKEQYGFIIKLAIDKNNGIDTYSNFIQGGAIQELKEFIENNPEEIKEKCQVTDETVKNALIQEGIITEELKKKIEELEMSEEFIKEKDIKNISTAFEIVEGYFEGYRKANGEKITSEEKRIIIERVLSNSHLNKEYSSYLTTLIDNLDKAGIQEKKEQCGFIIKSAVDGNGIGAYSDFVRGKAIPKLKEFIENNPEGIKEKCQVTDKTVKNALIQEGIIPEELKTKITKLGISEKLIKAKDIRNINTAFEIVEGYFEDYRKEDESEITKEEKRIIIERILSNACLNKGSSEYLTTLIDNLDQAGIKKKKEQYGFIIKSAVEGNGIDSYSYFILGIAIPKLKEFIENNPEEIKEKCQVTDETVKNALIQEGIIPEELKKKIAKLGMSEEFIEEKNIRNISTVFEIVEGYFEDYRKANGEKISNEEKKIIIERILSSSSLDKKNHYHLTTLIDNLENSGIQNKKEQYGFIIRLAIDKNNGIDAYTNFIKGTSIPKLKQFIENNPEGIKEKCQVTDETILKAKQKAEKLMKKALNNKRKNGTLSEVESTFEALQELSSERIPKSKSK